MQMLKTACAIFVLMSFVGGIFAMLAYSFQSVDKIIKGRPLLFQKPSFRMLVVWMIFFGIFGAYYFTSSKYTSITEHGVWYGVSLILMPIAALLGTALIRVAMADKIKKINKVYITIEAKEKAKNAGKKAKKKGKGKGKGGDEEKYKDYETMKDEEEDFEDDDSLYRLGKDKNKEDDFLQRLYVNSLLHFIPRTASINDPMRFFYLKLKALC